MKRDKMKRDKKFNGFKFATISMVIVGIGGVLIPFFLARREKQEFDGWIMARPQQIQKTPQPSIDTSFDSSINVNTNDNTHNEPNNEPIKQTDEPVKTQQRVKTQEVASPTKADLPLNQEDTLPVDAEEAYYAQFDVQMNQTYGVPLEMIGIPRFDEDATAMYFEPTDADLQRQNEIEAEAEEAAGKGLLAKEERDEYFPYPVGDDQTVYVHPDFLERYDELVEEYSAIQERSMHEGPTVAYSTMPYKERKLPDGTVLIYYRRRNGDLVRSIEKPDGTIRKWVIGWTDLTPYEQYTSSKRWRDD